MEEENKIFLEKLELAKNGDPQAQFEVAQEYRIGDIVKQSYRKAFYWYKKSADQGHEYACNDIGVMYMDGLETKKDKKQALNYFTKAFEKMQKNNRCNECIYYNIGNIYYYGGYGVKKDLRKALKFYKESAKTDAISQNILGIMYENGEGCEVDNDKAFHWYSKSAENRNKYGQYNLATCYIDGVGTKKDYKKALYWYKESAINGYNGAEYKVGLMYELGAGTPKNPQKALEWYKKSADNGYVKAKNAYNRLRVKQQVK